MQGAAALLRRYERFAAVSMTSIHPRYCPGEAARVVTDGGECLGWLCIFRNAANGVTLCWIQADGEERGKGERMIRQLTDLADLHGTTLSLTVEGSSGLDESKPDEEETEPDHRRARRLLRWYRRHGFAGRPGAEMHRHPQTPDP